MNQYSSWSGHTKCEDCILGVVRCWLVIGVEWTVNGEWWWEWWKWVCSQLRLVLCIKVSLIAYHAYVQRDDRWWVSAALVLLVRQRRCWGRAYVQYRHLCMLIFTCRDGLPNTTKNAWTLVCLSGVVTLRRLGCYSGLLIRTYDSSIRVVLLR